MCIDKAYSVTSSSFTHTIQIKKRHKKTSKIDKKRKRILRQAETLDDSEKDAFTFFFSNKSPQKLVSSVQELSPDRVAYKNEKKEKDKKLQQQKK